MDKRFLCRQKNQIQSRRLSSRFPKTENGSPQGVVLSPTLFNVTLDTLRTAMNHFMVTKGIDLSQFPDDSAFWTSANGLKRALFIFQLALNVIEDWGKNWGFAISPEKNTSSYYQSQRHRHLKIAKKLKLNDRILEYKREATFLGMIFDDKLTWKKHKQINNKMPKRPQRIESSDRHLIWSWQTDTQKLIRGVNTEQNRIRATSICISKQHANSSTSCHTKYSYAHHNRCIQSHFDQKSRSGM